MNSRKFFIHSILFLSVICLPACSNTNNKVPAEKATVETKKTPQAHEAKKHDPSKHGNKEKEDLPEFKVGDNIKDIIYKIKVKTTNGKEKSMKDFLGSDKTLIAVVKPGCVFCESMLAVKSATGVSSKAKFLVMLDANHADYKKFKEKYNKFKSAGGEWLLDLNNDLKYKLGIASYPRLILLDKAGNVEFYQTGLIIPPNPDQLDGKPFPEILQKLAEETVKWMSQN